MTDDFLDALAADLTPTAPGAATTRIIAALAVGALAAFVGMAVGLQIRPDLVGALSTGMFWMKLAYTGAIGLIAAAAAERLARPGYGAGARLAWLLAPVTLLFGMSLWRLAQALPGEVAPMIMGKSHLVCPWYIAAVSAPLFAAAMWAVRGLAPTRLRLAGGAAGLAAGGLAAAIYSLHCPETGAPFVAIWYSAGMLIPCILGALLGPRLLRW